LGIAAGAETNTWGPVSNFAEKMDVACISKDDGTSIAVCRDILTGNVLNFARNEP
jgi:hypothetical protein